jgi:hypothetical protein|tara:strand:+ start:392 stop:1231 length:840 start_codon:yes stop_codon:yes gene_type:complete
MNTTLQNLYINKEYYSKEYNFYNYFKYKQTGVIPVYYKTPSIFLDGLYFKVDDCQIIKVENKQYDTDFILTIKLYEDDFIQISNAKNTSKIKTDKIIDIFKELEYDNKHFFKKNYKFFPLKRKRTNKNIRIKTDTSYEKEKDELKDKIKLDWDGTPLKEIEHTNLSYRFNKPEQYASYAPFLKSDTQVGNLTLNVIIKHNYFFKLLNYIKTNKIINDFTYLNNLEKYCNQDFYMLKKSSIVDNFNNNNIDIKLSLCLKSNIFYLDGKYIKMKWSICDFN